MTVRGPSAADPDLCLYTPTGEVRCRWSSVRPCGVDSIIRICAHEVRWIPRRTGVRFAVANLQDGQHVPGQIYGLPRIVRHGWYRPPEPEVDPLLDLADLPLARCVAHHVYPTYDQVPPAAYAQLFPPLRCRHGLQAAICLRYGRSLPNLARAELLRLGVSITELEIVGRDGLITPSAGQPRQRQCNYLDLVALASSEANLVS